MKVYNLIFISGIFSFNLIQAQTDVWITLSTVVVTGTRIPQTLSEITQHVSVITKEEIEKSGANSVPELLDYIVGADIQERAPYGVQADVTLRGSTFQQVLILIDGVRVNNSQTAHHNMDLPVTLNDIERIEVLHGHGTSIYGPDAFGGVINIITKKPKKRDLSTKIKLGEYNTQLISFSYGNKGNGQNQKISIEGKRSDGFRYGTEFNVLNIFSNLTWEYPKGEINLSLGFRDTEFGAYDFYTPGKNLPSKEWTKTFFVKFKNLYEIGKITLQSNLFFKRHHDRFMLDRIRPTFYINEHITYLYGGETQLKVPVRERGNFIIGGEIVYDVIDSTGYGIFYDRHADVRRGLGKHAQLRKALFGEHRTLLFSNLHLNTGLRFDSSNWGIQVSPVLGIGYCISHFWKLRASIGRAFRIPSFTELYYKDPKNEGNPELKPEEAISYELGVDFTKRNLNAFITLFTRVQKNLIDWVGKNGPWRAENIGEVKIYGIDSEFKFRWHLFSIKVNYSRMGSKKTKEYYSKYALRYPTNQLSLETSSPLIRNITPFLRLIYKERLNETGYFLINGRITKKIKNAEVFIEGTNLLNQKYEEIKGVPQPGRWINIGINWKL